MFPRARHYARTAYAVAHHHRLAIVGIAAGGMPYVLPYLPGHWHVSGHVAVVLSGIGAGVSLLVKSINPPPPVDAVREIMADAQWTVVDKVERPEESQGYQPAPRDPAIPLIEPSGGTSGSGSTAPTPEPVVKDCLTTPVLPAPSPAPPLPNGLQSTHTTVVVLCRMVEPTPVKPKPKKRRKRK